MNKNLKYPLTKLIHWDDILKKLVEQSAKDNYNTSVCDEIRGLLRKGLIYDKLLKKGLEK